MPTGTQQFDDDDDDEFDGIEDTKLVKDLRRQLKERTKREEELAARLAVFETRDRERTLHEALSAKGLNAKAAKFYPADAELTDDAVTAWIADNAEIFGAKAADEAGASGPGGGTGSDNEQPDEPFVDPNTEAAYRRMQAAHLVGHSSTTQEQDVLRQISQSKSPEELTAFLRSARA